MIRAAQPADLESIQRIRLQSPEAFGWPVQTNDCLVYETDGEIAGLLVYRRIVDESEILNLAVASPFRRQGVAGALIRRLATNHTGDILLEVRASNSPALAL